MNTNTPLTAPFAGLAITFCLLFAISDGILAAEEDRALRKQRQEMQKERSVETREAQKEFRAFVKELEQEYRDKLREIDTQFDLKRVEIEAEHKSREAEAQLDYRNSISELLRQPDLRYDAQNVKRLWSEWQRHSDKLFSLKKHFATELHNETVAHETRKNTLLTRRDNEALAEAERLGLTREHKPILVVSTENDLTDKEERWNERERKKVAQIHERNARLLYEHRTGERLRKWEIDNLQQDFELEWREKSELHALDTEQMFLNTIIMQQADSEVDRNTFAERFSELNKERELVKIEYDKIRKKNAIRRREERRDILQK